MTIKLVYPDQETDFIRHARIETIKSLGEEPDAATIVPSPFAMYFVAYDEAADGLKPVGLAEIAFHDQVYESFAHAPYPRSMNLDQICPIEKMAGIRTIFLEPDYRRKTGAIYMQLLLAGCKVVISLGARFGAATTNATDTYLTRLYEKTGGRKMGVHPCMDGTVECDIAYYLFDLNELLQHKLMGRAASGARFDLDHRAAQTLRARTVWDQETNCT